MRPGRSEGSGSGRLVKFRVSDDDVTCGIKGAFSTKVMHLEDSDIGRALVLDKSRKTRQERGTE